MENVKTEVMEKIKEAQKVLIGIGKEWALRGDEKDIRFCHLIDPSQADLKAAYEALYDLIKEKDYYIVTTLTDGAVYEMPFDKNRIVAPCGNIHWRQCSKACTKDIWEESEVPDDVCPHCKAPLTGNTIKAETYIEEGYLPRWKDYMKWQTGTCLLYTSERLPTMGKVMFWSASLMNMEIIFPPLRSGRKTRILLRKRIRL